MATNSDYASILITRNEEYAPLLACKAKERSKKHATTQLVAWLILAALCYLTALGHRILDRLESSRVTEHDQKLRQRIRLDTKLMQDAESVSDLHERSESFTATAKVLIVYAPQDDPWQQNMAQAVYEGCQSISSLDCQVLTTATAKLSHISAADAIIIGSSVYNANVHPSVQQWIDQEWDILKIPRDKVGAAFVTAGGISAGQESTLKNLLSSLLVFGMLVVGGETWESAFGVAAITGEDPFMQYNSNDTTAFERTCYLSPGHLISPLFLEQAKGLGRRVARLVQ